MNVVDSSAWLEYFADGPKPPPLRGLSRTLKLLWSPH